MKKVLCLLLVLACSVALVACAGIGTANKLPAPGNENNETEDTGKPNVKDEGNESDKDFVDDKTEVDLSREQIFFSAVNNSQPNLIVTKTAVTNSALEATATGFYRTEINGENYVFSYKYDKFNKIGEGTSQISTVGPHTIEYTDGHYFLDGTEVYARPNPEVLNVDLNLNKNLLGNYVISVDGDRLDTKVSAANAEKILGVKISATGDVQITVQTDGTHLWMVSVSYTDNQTKVTIDTSYTYEPVSESVE